MEAGHNRTRDDELNAEERFEVLQEKPPKEHALTMLETAPDGVVNLDSEGRVLYVNPSAERVLGRERSKLQLQRGRRIEAVPAT